MAKQGELIVGLDIGTTKICAVVGEVTDEDGINVIGVGEHGSKGLRRGAVVNIEATVDSIRQAVRQAEEMANCEISSVYAGIANSQIKGFNSQGVVPVKDKEVRWSDVARVHDAACAVAIPIDRRFLHVLAQEYAIDGQPGIKEPLGMSGVRLEAKVHLVTADSSSMENIAKCAKRAGLEVLDVILQPLASAEAVLTEEEKDLGVALVDVGGGTADLVLFINGAVVHTAVIALGGNNFTSDIAVGLRTPAPEAERIKLGAGCCLASMIGKDETIEVPSVGGRPPRVLPRQILAEILEPRVQEIIELVRDQIDKSNYLDLLGAGAVFTGGATLLAGFGELAEDVLGVPVRCAGPRGVGGLVDVVKSSKYATAVGLVLYGARNEGLGLAGKRKRSPFRWLLSWLDDIF